MKRTYSLFAFTLAVIATAPAMTRANETVYQKLLPSAALVLTKLPDGKMMQGSAVIVDAQRKWLITSYHVARASDMALVIFPVQRKGQVVSEGKYYSDNLKLLARRGRVIARDEARDLAVIALPELPAEARAVPLAKESARPGQTVHLIGNPVTEEGLWLYSFGKVRQVYHKQWQSSAPDGFKVKLDCEVAAVTMPVNPGDSGSPAVNDQGELIGLSQGTILGSQAMTMLIDIREIRAVLAMADKQTQPG